MPPPFKDFKLVSSVYIYVFGKIKLDKLLTGICAAI
jgi:hypothetical protein